MNGQKHGDSAKASFTVFYSLPQRLGSFQMPASPSTPLPENAGAEQSPLLPTEGVWSEGELTRVCYCSVT